MQESSKWPLLQLLKKGPREERGVAGPEQHGGPNWHVMWVMVCPEASKGPTYSGSVNTSAWITEILCERTVWEDNL